MEKPACPRCLTPRPLRNGHSPRGVPRFRCRGCRRTFQAARRIPLDGNRLTAYLCEGASLRGVGRLLGVSHATVIRHIRRLAAAPRPAPHFAPGGAYEVDEFRIFIGCKECEAWVCYALCRATRQVAAFAVGRRTKLMLGRVVQAVLRLRPARIFTDGLEIYKTLVPNGLHCTHRRYTNRIERMNLTLRSHLKRFSRRTVCFSRSQEMAGHCLRLYFSRRGTASSALAA